MVKLGGIRMHVPLGQLVPGDEPAGPAGRTSAPGRRANTNRGSSADPPRTGVGWSGRSSGGITAATELDLRGQRVDEAEITLLRALDDAAAVDLRELRVIHGKGTGALRQLVAEVLSRDARVVRFRAGTPAEGGHGVTVVGVR